MRSTLPLLLVSLISLGAEGVSEAEQQTQPSWIVAAYGGAALPIPSNHVTSRGVAGLSLTRVFWRIQEVEISVGAGLSKIAKEVMTSARYGLRLSVGQLTFSVGLRLGYVASRVAKGELGELWTGALVIEPGAMVSYRFSRHLELRAALPGVALHYNQIWLARWEPTLGLGVGF